MNKKLLNNTLIALLLSITIFSVFKYVSSVKERYDLLNSLNQTKELAAVLANEKQGLLQELEKEKELQKQLSQENSALKDNLRLSEEKVAKLDTDFTQAQKDIEQLASRFSILKAENKALIDKNSKLGSKINGFSQENERLKVKLSSIAELKKAIRELKKQVYKVGVIVKQKVEAERTMEGNRGYLIKDGRFTYPARIKIEVTPAPVKK
jgi:chromosome segregation ATPase